MNLRKVFSSFLAVLLLSGNVVCVCTASAGDDGAGADTHHQHQPDAPMEMDCQHQGCSNDCSNVEALSPNGNTALVASHTDQFEEAHAVALETNPYPSARQSVAWTGPPQKPLLPADTPVHRHERLLE